MGIPPGDPGYSPTLHRMKAADQVFDRSANYMVQARASIGGWRTLIEHERFPACVRRKRLAEKIFLFPALEGFLLYLDQRVR